MSAMPAPAWKRLHGYIVAEVHGDGRGAWRSQVWLSLNPTVKVNTQRELSSLSAAQDKADALVRKTFDHHCNEGCGAWTWDSGEVV